MYSATYFSSDNFSQLKLCPTLDKYRLQPSYQCKFVSQKIVGTLHRTPTHSFSAPFKSLSARWSTELTRRGHWWCANSDFRVGSHALGEWNNSSGLDFDNCVKCQEIPIDQTGKDPVVLFRLGSDLRVLFEVTLQKSSHSKRKIRSRPLNETSLSPQNICFNIHTISGV